MSLIGRQSGKLKKGKGRKGNGSEEKEGNRRMEEKGERRISK